MGPADALLSQLDRYNAALASLTFSTPVAAVYNPHAYARAPWEAYLKRYGATPKRTLFLGMNPGPWGMAQTGVPFGEVAAVRDWMRIGGPVLRPEVEHPKRPILGMACSRSEVSGRRLWELFSAEFGVAAAFFREHLVINYCPLVFMAESGRNVTPDKLPRRERDPLFALCDDMLARTITAYRPEFVIGVGAFARRRLEEVVTGLGSTPGSRPAATLVTPPRIGQILHPSPASPAANRGWSEQARAQLVDLGVWTVSPTESSP